MYTKSFVASTLLIAAALLGCAQADISAEGAVTRFEQRGDTVVATTPAAAAPTIDTADVQLVLRSDSLEQPSGFVKLGDRLLIGDRTRVHVLDTAGNYLRSSGRSGDGPGEFGSIAAMGLTGDSVLVVDARTLRLSVIDSSGAYVGSRRFAPSMPYVNPRRGSWQVVRSGTGVLQLVTENVRTDRPTRVALVWHDLESDSTHVAHIWDDVLWKNHERLITPVELFGPRALAAVAADGRYAFGNGLEYCLTITSVGATSYQVVCREWIRAPVTDAVRSPDLESIDQEYGFSGRPREFFETGLEMQAVGDFWPSFDRLLFDEQGRLWVRRIAPDQELQHPGLWYRFPELRPSYFGWDVFDRDGSLLNTVLLRSDFDPRLVNGRTALGIVELPSGELAIAEATW